MCEAFTRAHKVRREQSKISITKIFKLHFRLWIELNSTTNTQPEKIEKKVGCFICLPLRDVAMRWRTKTLNSFHLKSVSVREMKQFDEKFE